MRNVQLSTVLLILEKEQCKVPWSQGASAVLYLLSSTEASVFKYIPIYLIASTCNYNLTLLQIAVSFRRPFISIVASALLSIWARP